MSEILFFLKLHFLNLFFNSHYKFNLSLKVSFQLFFLSWMHLGSICSMWKNAPAWPGVFTENVLTCTIFVKMNIQARNFLWQCINSSYYPCILLLALLKEITTWWEMNWISLLVWFWNNFLKVLWNHIAYNLRPRYVTLIYSIPYTARSFRHTVNSK